MLPDSGVDVRWPDHGFVAAHLSDEGSSRATAYCAVSQKVTRIGKIPRDEDKEITSYLNTVLEFS